MSHPRLLKLTDRMLPFRANVENSHGTKAFGKKLLMNSQITWTVMKQKEISLFLDDDDGAQSCLTFTTPCIVTCQAPLPMEFSKQEYWSGLPFFSPGDLPNSGIEPRSRHCRQILYLLSHQPRLMRKARSSKKEYVK